MKKSNAKKNLERLLEIKDEILEGRGHGKYNPEIIPTRKKFITEQYKKTYKKAEEGRADLSNYPKPKALWKEQ